MSSTPAVLSAIAASLAAVLAALNLYVAGRREHTKWARDALIDVIVPFLDESFRSKDAVKHGLRAVQAGRPQELAAFLDEARHSEREMRRLQTRIRLLATPALIDACQQLRLRIREYIALARDEQDRALREDAQLKRDIWHLRQATIDEAKSALALPRSWRTHPKILPLEGQ